jgi:hypothetical protein
VEAWPVPVEASTPANCHPATSDSEMKKSQVPEILGSEALQGISGRPEGALHFRIRGSDLFSLTSAI